MTTKIEFSLADDAPFTIDGLGAFTNGSYTLTEAEEVAFVNANGHTVQEGFKSNPNVKVTGAPCVAAKAAVAELKAARESAIYFPGTLSADSEAPVVPDIEEPAVNNETPGTLAGTEGSDQ